MLVRLRTTLLDRTAEIEEMVCLLIRRRIIRLEIMIGFMVTTTAIGID